MKTIDRIKDDIEGAKDHDGTLWRYLSIELKDLKALVEYHRAAEMEFKYVGISGDTPMNRRLKQARARLEEEE